MEELISMKGFPMANNSLLQSLDLKFPKKLDILRIDNLDNILVPLPKNELPIKKYQIKELELCYNVDRALVPEDRINNVSEVLESFIPHKRLVHLKIENYYGKEYPSWILMLSNLQRLHLQNCVWCEKLPSLGALPQLKFLAMTGFGKLCSLGKELRGDLETKVAFPRLQQLYIGDMEALHTWSGLESQDLPQLQILRLLGCIKLIAIPLDHLQKSTTLTRLEVDTRTKTGMKDKLRGFTRGKVVNMDNTWEPQEDETVEVVVAVAVAPQNKQSPQQDEIVQDAVAPENERPRRLWFDWKKLAMLIFVLLPFFLVAKIF